MSFRDCQSALSPRGTFAFKQYDRATLVDHERNGTATLGDARFSGANDFGKDPNARSKACPVGRVQRPPKSRPLESGHLERPVPARLVASTRCQNGPGSLRSPTRLGEVPWGASIADRQRLSRRRCSAMRDQGAAMRPVQLRGCAGCDRQSGRGAVPGSGRLCDGTRRLTAGQLGRSFGRHFDRLRGSHFDRLLWL